MPLLLPNELWLAIIEAATFVPSELDPNIYDRFNIPSSADVGILVTANLPTRHSLVRVSWQFREWTLPILYRTIVVRNARQVNGLYSTFSSSTDNLGRLVLRFHLSVKRLRRWGGLNSQAS